MPHTHVHLVLFVIARATQDVHIMRLAHAYQMQHIAPAQLHTTVQRREPERAPAQTAALHGDPARWCGQQQVQMRQGCGLQPAEHNRMVPRVAIMCATMCIYRPSIIVYHALLLQHKKGAQHNTQTFINAL
jgi:hypothetical protein